MAIINRALFEALLEEQEVDAAIAEAEALRKNGVYANKGYRRLFIRNFTVWYYEPKGQ